MRAPEIDYRPTTGALIRRAAERFGDHDFVVTDSSRVTYAQVDRASRRLAKRLLIAGAGKGTRISAQFPYGPEWLIAWLGVTRIGGLFQPFSTAYKSPEISKTLRIGDVHIHLTPDSLFGHARAPYLYDAVPGLKTAKAGTSFYLNSHPFLREVWMTGDASSAPFAKPIDLLADEDIDRIVSDGFLERIEAEVFPADLMMTIYTSGTTSDPKCVMHTHGAAVRHGAELADLCDFKQSDRLFAGMPFFWVGGSCATLLPMMHVGGTILCIEKFDADKALDLMEAERATRILGWSGITGPLFSHPKLGERDIPLFKDPVYSRPSSLMTGLGMSETAANHTGFPNRDWDSAQGSGSVGQPLPFMDHKIVNADTLKEVEEGEEGVLLVRGYSLMTGYYKVEREDTFMPDGFFNTGDRVAWENGFMFFRGRNTLMIKTSGNNVAPAEVEAALNALANIECAFVFGIPDKERGEIVASFILPKENATVDIKEIQDKLREALSNYKVPRAFKFIRPEEIPWLATGKPDILKLQKMFADKV